MTKHVLTANCEKFKHKYKIKKTFIGRVLTSTKNGKSLLVKKLLANHRPRTLNTVAGNSYESGSVAARSVHTSHDQTEADRLRNLNNMHFVDVYVYLFSQ